MNDIKPLTDEEIDSYRNNNPLVSRLIATIDVLKAEKSALEVLIDANVLAYNYLVTEKARQIRLLTEERDQARRELAETTQLKVMNIGGTVIYDARREALEEVIERLQKDGSEGGEGHIDLQDTIDRIRALAAKEKA